MMENTIQIFFLVGQADGDFSSCSWLEAEEAASAQKLFKGIVGVCLVVNGLEVEDH